LHRERGFDLPVDVGECWLTAFDVPPTGLVAAGPLACTSIAVDPQFALQSDVSRNKPQLHRYQMTSDAFFAAWESPEVAAANCLGMAIRTSVPNPSRKASRGDYHFARSMANVARSLADALLRLCRLAAGTAIQHEPPPTIRERAAFARRMLREHGSDDRRVCHDAA
jgi:hypothetical protein